MEPGLAEFPLLQWAFHGHSSPEGFGIQANGPGVPVLPLLCVPPQGSRCPWPSTVGSMGSLCLLS